MSKEYKYNNFIFGKEYSLDRLNSDTILDLITEAKLYKALRIRQALLGVLGSYSKDDQKR